MSYDIYIGNAEVVVYTNEDNLPSSYSMRVQPMEHPDAPNFPGDFMTKNGNGRFPGYTQWSEFCRTAGLYDLFFSKEDGLIVEHPGNVALREDHAKEIERALQKWQKKHPDAIPGWNEEGDEDTIYDGILARLLWLDWWVKYALKNCERPCLYNS